MKPQTQTPKTTRPIKQSGYSHHKADTKNLRKYGDAIERDLSYNELSVADKIQRAKSRRGESKREIVRLTKQLRRHV